MSEFRSEWPRTGEINDHLMHIQEGIGVIESQMVTARDKRQITAYGALIIGGWVFSEGDTSTGKSELGNKVLGQHRRIDLVNTDTEATLYGYISPMTDRMVDTKIKHINEDTSPIIFLDEVSQVRDTGMLHRIGTGDKLVLPDGNVIDMTDAVLYSTANFPDGVRSKKLDPAIRARLGINILSGDGDIEHSKAVSRFVRPELSERYSDGLLPPAKIRRSLRQMLEKHATVDDESREYMVDVIYQANQSGLFKQIQPDNKRQLDSWVQAARGRRLVDSEKSIIGKISKEELAEVATLGLGSAVNLSAAATSVLTEQLGSYDTLRPIEKAVFARRALAGVAMKTFIDSRAIRGVSVDQEMAQFISKRSHANLLDVHESKGIDELIINAILNGSLNADEQMASGVQDEDTGNKGFFGRLRRSR